MSRSNQPSAASGPSGEAACRFDVPVPDSGYRWWYADGISDDGSQGVVVIAFIGSVFSPYYYRARQRQPADPLAHCAINVGLYRRRGKLWAMTERGRRAVSRDSVSFTVGRSGLRQTGGGLRIDIDERSMPFARRLRGSIHLEPDYVNRQSFPLDPDGHHIWRPIAPSGRLSVALTEPRVHWSGAAYFDTNHGNRALEDDFDSWDWSRQETAGGARILYAARLIGGGESSLALHFDEAGRMSETAMPPQCGLPMTGWRVPRTTRAVDAPRVLRTLEDTPFYARSLLRAANDADGREPIMHESLSLRRFRSAWVRMLLPFRMPRLP